MLASSVVKVVKVEGVEELGLVALPEAAMVVAVEEVVLVVAVMLVMEAMLVE